MLLSLHSYFRFCFRLIQAYSSIIQKHTHAYSELCVSLAYSEPRHIVITKHIQIIPRHIQNPSIFLSQSIFRLQGIFLISYLGRSIQFRMCLVSLSYRCYLTSRVTFGVFNVIFQTYSGIFKTYSAIFSLVQAY